MIARFRETSPASRAAGLVLLAGVGWFGLTSAGSEVSSELTSKKPTDLLQIEVEHPAIPTWRQSMIERLSKPIDLVIEDEEIDGLIARLRELTGTNFLLLPEAREDAYDEGMIFSMNLLQKSAIQVLEALRGFGRSFEYSFDEGIVIIGPAELIPNAQELRFYKLGPFYDQGEVDEDDLKDLVQCLASANPGSWEDEGVWIDDWNGLLVINHTRRTHDEVEAFLNRLLNHGRTPVREAPPWKTALEEKLAEPSSISARDQDLLSALQGFADQNDFNLWIHPDTREDLEGETVNLELAGVQRSRILSWMLRGRNGRMRLANGQVEVSKSLDLTLEFYDVSNLREAMELAGVDDLDYIEDMLRSKVDPESWDEHPNVALYTWRDQLLIFQSAGAHAQIRPLLGALERALTP